MPEQSSTPVADEKNQFAANGERAHPARKLTFGLAGLALIVVAGLVFSLVLVFRGDDAEPLVPLDQSTDSGQSQAEPQLFLPEPVKDRVNRVIYVPVDSKGVVLSESTIGTNGRPVTQAPSGVMLQRIHGNMDLPFSTSDGPTGFTDNGIAIGFSRTAQGAALAAAHYSGYLISGPDRQKMLMDAGLLSDPDGEVAKTDLGIRDNIPASALPMVKVLFNRDKSLVLLGRPVEKSNGSRVISYSQAPMVWREGTGWVLEVDRVTMGEGSEPAGAAEWSSWWGINAATR